MKVLEVVVNSKVYQIGCQENEKDYILKVISQIEDNLTKLKDSNPSFAKLDTDKLFLYQLIILHNELNELKSDKLSKQNAIHSKQNEENKKNSQKLGYLVKKLQNNTTALEEHLGIVPKDKSLP